MQQIITFIQLVTKNCRLLWNPKVHYRAHKIPPPNPTLSYLTQVHIVKTNICKIPFKFIFKPTSSYSKSFFFPSGFALNLYFTHPEHAILPYVVPLRLFVAGQELWRRRLAVFCAVCFLTLSLLSALFFKYLPLIPSLCFPWGHTTLFLPTHNNRNVP